MGALLSIPFLGSIGGLGSTCLTGLAFFCTGQAVRRLATLFLTSPRARTFACFSTRSNHRLWSLLTPANACRPRP